MPQLPENIRGLLNQLRDLRNQLAHHGKLEDPLNKNDLAKMLCAALFGFHYVRMAQLMLFS